VLLAAGILLALLQQGQETRARAIDVALALWFVLTALALPYVGRDAHTVTPQPVIMKWGWPDVAPRSIAQIMKNLIDGHKAHGAGEEIVILWIRNPV
jgi:hypothetical protein